MSDLLVFVDADLAVLSGDGGQLHADVAVLVPAEEARLGHQGEHRAVHPGPLDHHHGPVERHLDDVGVTTSAEQKIGRSFKIAILDLLQD